MRKMAFYTVLAGLLVVAGCSAEKSNTEKQGKPDTAVTSKSGEETTKKEETIHPGVEVTDLSLPLQNSEKRTENITHLMIHFISNASLKPENPYVVEDIDKIFRDYGLSIHYMVDREGKIYQLVSEDRVAYHAGKGSLPDFPGYDDRMNDYSIGIEVLAIGTREEMLPIISGDVFDSIDPTLIGYTDAQYKALKSLVDDILKRNPTILRDRKHVIGHDEYAPGRKTDPGSLFDWSRIGF